MTWLKLDDQMYTHPKVINLSSPAFRVHVGGLLHSAQQLTDGEITLAALYSLVLPDMKKKPQVIAAEITAANLWTQTGDDTWVINDYLEYNPSRNEVLTKREADRKRKAGGS